MKKAFTLLALVILSIGAIAQTPQNFIPWQAIIRDTSWNPIPLQNVTLKFTITDGGSNNFYQETQSVTTNELGMVNIQLGAGTTSDNFSAIPWNRGSKYLRVELDASGGTNYAIMGTSQMMSVPYSLFSEGSSTLSGPVNQVPYYDSTGLGTSDPGFTRNASDFVTTLSRVEDGVMEGIHLDHSGAYFARIDTPTGHTDLVGEMYSPPIDGSPDDSFVHQIGVLCMSWDGPKSGILLEDQNPINPKAQIFAAGYNSWFSGGFYIDANVFNGVLHRNDTTGPTQTNGILADTAALHLISNAKQWTWPTAYGTNGQVLTTDSAGGLNWTSGSSAVTGTGIQIPYFNHAGILTGDPYFTRNDTDFTTTLVRVKDGIKEGLMLGRQIGLNNSDGAFFAREDSAAGHFDLIGEFYGKRLETSDTTPVHQIGILCMDNSGPGAGIFLIDSDPQTPRAEIGAGDGSGHTGKAVYMWDTVYTGVIHHDSLINGIVADDYNLHLVSSNYSWNWPTVDGTSGQSLTTDGAGNLSWNTPSSTTTSSILTPSSGDTVTAVWGTNIVKPTIGISALTISLPPSPIDNETVFFTFSKSIDALSFTGGTVDEAITNVVVSSGVSVKYWLTYSGGTWY